MSNMTYLNAATTTEIIQALDQYGIPYTGADLANTTVSSDTPANVGAALGAFDPTSGQATLTLTQAGGEGTANVIITDGAVSLAIPVQSYTPALTSFSVLASATTPNPAPAAVVNTGAVASA